MQGVVETLIWPVAALLVVFTAGWLFATRKREPGRRKPGGFVIAAAFLLGIGHVMDPPQERAIEAKQKEEKPDENGEPPLG